MSKLDDAKRLLATLSRAEKAKVLQLIAKDLGDDFPGVESTPGVCGGDPCIVRTRIPIWLLESYRRLGVSESELLRCYPTLRAEDLATAWAFVRAHQAEIERQISEHQEA
ncbi:MAG: DUF433 domain-containing protein [Planctomycetes bacterium]|nr:DUF433 domain-containing protein [Planctomycetota bacterium]